MKIIVLFFTYFKIWACYREELFFRPIKSNYNSYINSIFVFNHTSTVTRFEFDNASLINYNYLPPSFVDIMLEYDIKYLKLGFSLNKWNTYLYGPSISDAASGIYLLAIFNNASNIDIKWNLLTNSLSGMFCTSISSSSTNYGVDPLNFFNSDYTRLAILPVENVCTENFTPWKKLLPCKKQLGLITLFHEIEWFNKDYLSLTIEISITNKASLQIYELSFISTLNLLNNLRGHTIESFKTINGLTKFLYGKSLYAKDSYCSLTEGNTYIYILKENSQNLDEIVHSEKFNINTSKNLLLKFSNNPKIIISNGTFKSNQQLHLNVYKYITGYGRQDATLNIVVENNSGQLYFNESARKESFTCEYLEIIPNFIKLYASSIKIKAFTNNGTIIQVTDFALRYSTSPNYITKKYEKAASTLIIKISDIYILDLIKIKLTSKIEYKLLPWSKYPPDSNHGFYLPNGLFKYYSATQRLTILFDEALLMILPTPDFSMPYNVLCFSCTILALTFGTIFNFCSKKYVLFIYTLGLF